ncbi:MAG: hemolysin family protein [Bacteroidales bacterium]|jgi:putative hemolysin|nr:hemolysin family protein [Bacteroidales bacterium]
MEIGIIFLLIVFNGILSLSEISLISSRRIKMNILAKANKRGANKALILMDNPERFLSTVQVGITLVGILTGVYSGDTLTVYLRDWLISLFPNITQYAGIIAKAIVVLTVTYFTIVLGELIPKRLAMITPETLLRRFSGFLRFFSKLFYPFVWILEFSVRWAMRILNIKPTEESKITEEEILAAVKLGTSEGEIQDVEQDIIERVFDIGDRDVKSVMTHRNDLVCIDINHDLQTIQSIVHKEMHGYYPVIDKHLDNLMGVISLKDIFGCVSSGEINMRDLIMEPVFFPETTSAYKALKHFKETQLYYGFAVDEFGTLQGMITSVDIMEALLGRMTQQDDNEETILPQEDGTWIVDGQYSFYDFLAYFDMEEIFQEYDFNTLSGLILNVADHIPRVGEIIRWKNFSFEIHAMDTGRIDKVLVVKMDEVDE